MNVLDWLAWPLHTASYNNNEKPKYMPVNKTMEQYAHYIAIAGYVTKSASNWNHCD